MKKLWTRALPVAVLLTAPACTPEEIERWLAWNERDPIAAQEFARRPEVVAALADATAAQSAPAVSWTVDWDAVAWCESGGNWGHGPVSNSHGTFSGGLMIGHQWWRAHGGGEFASVPYYATKAQQIIVAERIVDGNGGGYAGADRGWQCVR